jgi:hypothetical protein
VAPAVEVVSEVQLDVIDAEPVQAGAQLAGDPLGPQAVVRTGVHRVERLGGELWTDPTRGDPAADRQLAAPAAVGVGGVEVGDAGLPGGVHQGQRLILGQSPAEELRRRADPAEVAAAKCDTGDGRGGTAGWLPGTGCAAHRPAPPLMIICDIQPNPAMAGQQAGVPGRVNSGQ